MTLTLWHNPRCAKSRKALDLLLARGLCPAIRLYLEDPPSPAELQDVLHKLGKHAIALARTGDEAFRALDLPADADDARILRALAANPRLIERPLLMHGARAAIGRPPEAILSIL